MSPIFGSFSTLAIIAIQLLLIRSVFSASNITNEYLNHKCNNTQGKYTPGSVFERNLNGVLRQVSINKLINGYAYISSVVGYKVSKDPNIVFVLLQCRGDTDRTQCLDCFTAALSGLRIRCPGNRGAIIWYDQCLLDISSVDSEGRIHYESNFWITNKDNARGNLAWFKKKRQALMDMLILQASKIGRVKKGPLYSAGEVVVGGKKLYGMAQCTQDLTENGCHVCQEWINETYADCCNGKAGARVIGRSCNLRYEFYPFVRTHTSLQ